MHSRKKSGQPIITEQTIANKNYAEAQGSADNSNVISDRRVDDINVLHEVQGRPSILITPISDKLSNEFSILEAKVDAQSSQLRNLQTSVNGVRDSDALRQISEKVDRLQASYRTTVTDNVRQHDQGFKMQDDALKLLLDKVNNLEVKAGSATSDNNVQCDQSHYDVECDRKHQKELNSMFKNIKAALLKKSRGSGDFTMISNMELFIHSLDLYAARKVLAGYCDSCVDVIIDNHAIQAVCDISASIRVDTLTALPFYGFWYKYFQVESFLGAEGERQFRAKKHADEYANLMQICKANDPCLSEDKILDNLCKASDNYNHITFSIPYVNEDEWDC